MDPTLDGGELGELRRGAVYRPTGLSAPARTLVRLVDELTWVNVVLTARPVSPTTPMNRSACDVKVASAMMLDEAPTCWFGVLRCSFDGASAVPPTELATRAAAASRRLDDAFRTYLAERGAKPVSLADMTSLVTGVAAARAEPQRTSDLVKRWYDDLAVGLASAGAVRPALAHDASADERLVEAVRQHLRDDEGRATATTVRMLWTGDHLDAARLETAGPRTTAGS